MKKSDMAQLSIRGMWAVLSAYIALFISDKDYLTVAAIVFVMVTLVAIVGLVEFSMGLSGWLLIIVNTLMFALYYDKSTSKLGVYNKIEGMAHGS